MQTVTRLDSENFDMKHQPAFIQAKSKMAIALMMAFIGCLGCKKPPTERNLSNLKRLGLTYVDPDSGEPYTGAGIHIKGTQSHTGTLVNGRKDGVWNATFGDGAKHSHTTYKDGKRHGMRTFFYKNGNKKREGNYVGGRKDGAHTRFDKDGQKRDLTHYKAGKRHGLKTVWKNGSKWRETTYENDRIHGTDVAFKADGSPASTCQWDRGVKGVCTQH